MINVYLIGPANKTKMEKNEKLVIIFMLPYLAKSLPWLPEVLVSFAFIHSYLFYARRRQPLVARDINITSMLSCNLKTCKTGCIFCDVSYYVAQW